MLNDKLTNYFLPASMRYNKAHARYDEFHVLISSFILGPPIMGAFGIFLLSQGKSLLSYFIFAWSFTSLVILFSIKYFSHYRIPMGMLAIFSYGMTYTFISDTGMIYSPSMTFVHMYLLAGIWTDKKWGWMFTFSNLALIVYIYYQSIALGLDSRYSATLGSPVYVLGLHMLFTIASGTLLGYEQYVQESNRRKIKDMQDQQIHVLDETVKKRTEQLNTIRQAMAADFHDYTGNMLSAITRQASMLKVQLQGNLDVLPVVESIIQNSNDLYASSKDFLWNLNHDSDDAAELFEYLTGYGQAFYNQFDISFSSGKSVDQHQLHQLDPFAALNLIFIFKEAMTNVVKHSAASEVELSMNCRPGRIVYALIDNGRWKQESSTTQHYGLENIRKRSLKNNFEFALSTYDFRTRIEVAVPYVGTGDNNSYMYE